MKPMTGGPATGGGLMPRGLAPQRADGVPAGETDDPDQVSAEEQQQYDHLVSNAFRVIYSPKTFPVIVKSLQGGGDPVEGLAQTAVNIFKQVLNSAQESGFEASGDAKWAAGKEVFEDLAELSGQAGVHDFAGDADGLESAFFRAADAMRVGLQSEGRLDQNTAHQDMARLQRMDQMGDLERRMMSLAARDAGSSANSRRPTNNRISQRIQ